MKMTRYTITLLIFTVITLAICSCELETSGNGDLDGMWCMVRVDSLETGFSEDITAKRLYWSVQSNLIQLDDKNGRHSSVLLRFEQNDGKLRLYNPYFYDRETGDFPVTDVSYLTIYGINALDENFVIESLDGSHMTLCSEKLRLYFKKF